MVIIDTVTFLLVEPTSSFYPYRCRSSSSAPPPIPFYDHVIDGGKCTGNLSERIFSSLLIVLEAAYILAERAIEHDAGVDNSSITAKAAVFPLLVSSRALIKKILTHIHFARAGYPRWLSESEYVYNELLRYIGEHPELKT